MTKQITLTGNLPLFAREDLAIENLAVYPVPLTSLRVWDAMASLLPSAGAADDLGLVGGTWATGTPSLKTSDAKATTVTQRARFVWAVPVEYVAAQRIRLRLHAGMLTTISDGTATIDVEVFKSNRESLVSGSDLVSTAAITINSLAFADKEFTVDPTTLSPGDTLDVRVTIAITDTATGTVVTGCIGAIEWLMDIRG